MFTVEIKNTESGIKLDVFVSKFDTGQLAAEYARELNAHYGNVESPLRARVIQMKPESAIDWREREVNRFIDSTYSRVPWAGESWFIQSMLAKNHMAHISEKNSGKIAYTQSDAKGIADIQTPILPGRYLTKYFGDILTEREIRDYASRLAIDSKNIGIEFVFDGDKIAEIYRNGPRSCMGGRDDNYFSCNMQPTKVYGAGDIALAVMRNESNSVICRAITWPNKKIYACLYGDGGTYSDKLRSELENLGFNSSHNFSGAKLLKIESPDGDGFIMPYLDIGSSCGESECGEFLIIGSDTGSIYCHSEHGTTGYGYSCEACGDSGNEDSFYYIDGYGRVCEECTGYCEHCNETCLGQDMVSTGCGEYVCGGCAESMSNCDNCGDLHESLHDTIDGEICNDCIEEYGICENCGEYHKHDSLIEVSSECKSVCNDCIDSYFKCEDCDEYFDKDDSHEYHSKCCDSCGEDRLESEPILELAIA